MDTKDNRSSKTRSLLTHSVRLCVAAVAVLFSLQTSAELYKYVNEDGVTVLDSHVPARYVKDGYTILSISGKVLEVVPRALTDEEIRVRDKRIAVNRELERRAREQKIADQNLLRIYSKPEDVIRARDSKMASVEGFINTSKTNLARLQSQQRQMQSQLANIERAGGSISADRLNQIRIMEDRIRQSEKEIGVKRNEKSQLQTNFAADLRRVKELYEAPSGGDN